MASSIKFQKAPPIPPQNIWDMIAEKPAGFDRFELIIKSLKELDEQIKNVVTTTRINGVRDYTAFEQRVTKMEEDHRSNYQALIHEIRLLRNEIDQLKAAKTLNL